MKRLILASQSPARAALLKQVGYRFTVEPSAYEEDMSLPMAPAALAVHLATGKAQDIASKHTDAVVVAADTFVVFEGNNLGKPHTAQNATTMLQMLRGKTHQIITGLCVVDCKTGNTHAEAQTCSIQFRDLSDLEIREYVATEEPLEKAGAYAIGMKAAIFAEKIDGDFYTIVGLPMARLSTLLAGHAIYPEWQKNKP